MILAGILKASWYEKKGGKMVPNCVPKNESIPTGEMNLMRVLPGQKEGKNKSGGLNEKGRKSYERENPGSDLKRPSRKLVTSVVSHSVPE